MSERTVLVTGASSGIGAAIAQRLLMQGHRVVGIARDFSKNPVAAKGFRHYELDLSELDALPARLTELVNIHPEIDALVCNAGQGRFGSLEEFSYGQIRGLVDLNFTSQLFLVRAFLPQLKKMAGSDVVLMGSEAALSGGRRGVVYAATKAALRGCARALREECSRSGVRVSLINPGAVRTNFYRNAPFEPAQEADNALDAEEVAETVYMILSSRRGVVFDEVNLSPLKKVLDFRRTRQ